jgi:PilZ domain
MNPVDERRGAARRSAEAMGKVSFGAEDLPCRVIDVSATGAQVRVDGRRASRNMVGKRVSLAIDGTPEVEAGSFSGHVVWARPAVNGVYLGLSFSGREVRTSSAPPAES